MTAVLDKPITLKDLVDRASDGVLNVQAMRYGHVYDVPHPDIYKTNERRSISLAQSMSNGFGLNIQEGRSGHGWHILVYMDATSGEQKIFISTAYDRNRLDGFPQEVLTELNKRGNYSLLYILCGKEYL